MKKSKNIMFVIAKPEVFKSPTSDSYIIFGEAKIEDLAAKQAALEAEKAAYRPEGNQASKQAVYDKSGIPPAKNVAPQQQPLEEETSVDESGVDANDIKLVVDQAHCTRARAVAALRNNGNDIVNAIMELTI
jgi:nascent polypeptide-associated complex subunit alpha